MPKDDATKFRRIVARLNHLALDRPDLCVVAGKLSRCMARPREGDVKHLKRVFCYLQGEPRGYCLPLAASSFAVGGLD